MPLLQSLIGEKRFKDAAAFQVDYDSQRDFLRVHRVRWQSTLIVFKGVHEKGRSVADLEEASVIRLLERAL